MPSGRRLASSGARASAVGRRAGRDQRAEATAEPAALRRAVGGVHLSRCSLDGDLARGLEVGQRTRRTGIVGHHRLAVRRRLRDPHRARDRGLEHLVAEVLAHLVGHAGGEPGPGVVHRDQDRGDVQALVQVRADHLDGLEQLAEALQRVVLRLDRDHHLVAGHQRVQGEQAQRRRAVDEDVVEPVLPRLLGGARPAGGRGSPCAAGSRGPPPRPARSRRRPGRWSPARRPGSPPRGWGCTPRPAGRPSTRASYVDGTPRRCSTPSAVEALPCGSRSMTSTRCPSWASAAATFTVEVVLPTPPFWLATTKIRVAAGRSSGRPHPGAVPGQHGVLGGLGQRRRGVADRSPVRRPRCPPRCAPGSSVSRETSPGSGVGASLDGLSPACG